MKTTAECEAYIIGLERCIAEQTSRETDLRWQLAQMTGQLKEAQRQAGAFCHRSIELELELAELNASNTTFAPFELLNIGGNHG